MCSGLLRFIALRFLHFTEYLLSSSTKYSQNVYHSFIFDKFCNA